MKWKLTVLVLAAAMALVSCSGRAGDGPLSSATDEEVALFRGHHDGVSDHLAAAMIWSDLVREGTMSKTAGFDLDHGTAKLDQELQGAIDLAIGLQAERLTETEVEARPTLAGIVSRLEEGRRHLEEFRSSLRSGDRTTSERALESVENSIETAAAEHDAMIEMVADSRLQFRMFAVSWPHQYLALDHAAFLADLNAIEAVAEPARIAETRARLEDLQEQLRRSKVALRGFADRLYPLTGDYARERGTDLFNRLTDEIRQSHQAIDRDLGDLRTELARPRPDPAAALQILQRMREQIQMAEKSHRELLGGTGQPYPEFASAFANI